MIKKIKINDILAILVLVIIIPGLWIGIGLGKLTVAGEITGATIMAWGLVLQYYFRRKPPTNKEL